MLALALRQPLSTETLTDRIGIFETTKRRHDL